MNYCKMFIKKWEPTLSGVTSNELNQRKKDEPFEAKSSFCRRRVLFDWRRLAYRPYVKNGVHHDWFSAPPPPTDHRRNGYYDAAASSGDYYDRFYSYDLEEATRPRSLGQGQIRVSGRQAEISCHFPAHLDIVSNVIWQRIDDGSSGSGSYYWHGGDRLHSDGRTTIRQYPTGSTLYIADFGVRDFGLYRCSASQSVYVRGRSAPTTRTLYQQVFFEGLNN